jgi:putative sensory transducer protein
MKKKLENMHLKERIDYGYRKVITMMLISGLLSVVIIGVLFANMMHYVEDVNAADQAVKICRINVNAAARNIREMALNEDTSSYDNYEQTVKRLLSEVDSELQILKKTEVLSDENYEEYASALSDWGEIGYSIIEEIKNGNDENATDAILNNCTPALNKVVEIAIKLDELTDEASSETVRNMVVCTVAGFVVIIVCLVFAFTLTRKTSKRVLETILEPLHAIEDVAMELTEGNLHSTLEYHSDDEIGKLAHSMRKSIRILGTYVDDIDRSMKLFSEGNFDVHPEVEWRGDFVGILNSFMAFQASMAGTIKGIQNVSNEVSGAAEQVASSSNDLADGATNQAAVVEELTATVTGVSEQVEKNSQSAKEISVKVDELGNAISESNGKMHEMVDSMHEISEASKEIDKIITTINEIASQTNLLALNASIEAARAGEAGKGFAVVANQVNVLADQSAQAAKESATLIETSVKAVEKGMVIAGQTAAQLEEVAENSKVITTEVTNIAETLETQTTEIKQINEGIEQINDVVQTNSATSEECAAASQEMSSEAESLREMISKFKVAEDKKTV